MPFGKFEYESKLDNHSSSVVVFLVPDVGIEPTTYALSRRCSTAELIRHVLVAATKGIEPS